MRKTHIPPTVFDQACYHVGCATIHLWRALVAISTLRIWTGIITSAIILAFIISMTGCGGGPGRILMKGGGLMGPQLEEVKGVKDAGSPATVATSSENTGIKVPKGSAITVTKTEAVAATESAPFQPAVEVIAFTPAADTEYRQTAQHNAASTGTIDTSVAKHRIDAAQRIWLLYAAIGCGIGGLILRSALPSWPGLSNGLLIGAPIAFAAWKFSEVPAWLFVVGIIATGLIAFGYKRAEWDKDGDGKPDIFQKKKA